MYIIVDRSINVVVNNKMLTKFNDEFKNKLENLEKKKKKKEKIDRSINVVVNNKMLTKFSDKFKNKLESLEKKKKKEKKKKSIYINIE